jgi:hypothetical protein
MYGALSPVELLTVGPRFVGSPNVKSAFESSAVRPNAKTKITTILAIFIFFSFQSLSLRRQGTVNIFTPHTMRSFYRLSLIMMKTSLMEYHLDFLFQTAYAMQAL